MVFLSGLILPAWGNQTANKLLEIEQRLQELEIRIQEKQKALEQTSRGVPSAPNITTIRPKESDNSQKEDLKKLPEESKTTKNQYGATIHKEGSSNEEIFEGNRNSRLGINLGFVLPNDNEMGLGEISFDPGFSLGTEYSWYFPDLSYIELGFEMRFFNASGGLSVPTNNGDLYFQYSGDCMMSNLYFTLGQEWEIYESISLLTQASMGLAMSNYELNFMHQQPGNNQNIEIPMDITETSFYYSFMIGIAYSWNQKWQSSFYYEFDGRSEAGDLDYQSFHQLGVETGFRF